MNTVNKTSTSPKVRYKNWNEQVSSFNKKVKAVCQKNRETSAKLANFFYYFHKKNLKEGGNGTFTTTKKSMSLLLNRGVDTVTDVVRELRARELFIIKECMGKRRKVTFEVTPTQKMLDLKNPPKKIKPIPSVSKISPNTNTLIIPDNAPLQENFVPVVTFTSNTGLNSAYALKTFDISKKEKQQPKVEKVEEEPPKVVNTNQSGVNFPDQAREAMEEILLPALSNSPKIVNKAFKKALLKLQKTHFGHDPEIALERFREYLTKIANNAFLTGKKAMKNLKCFVISIGFILTASTIEASWTNTGFFNVWEPKQTQSQTKELEEEEMARPPKAAPLPPLTLREAVEVAESDRDRQIKTRLYEALGAVTYQTWFYTTGFVAKDLHRGEPDFSIQSAFARDYILTHYADVLKEAFRKGSASMGGEPFFNAFQQKQRREPNGSNNFNRQTISVLA